MSCILFNTMQLRSAGVAPALVAHSKSRMAAGMMMPSIEGTASHIQAVRTKEVQRSKDGKRWIEHVQSSFDGYDGSILVHIEEFVLQFHLPDDLPAPLRLRPNQSLRIHLQDLAKGSKRKQIGARPVDIVARDACQRHLAWLDLSKQRLATSLRRKPGPRRFLNIAQKRLEANRSPRGNRQQLLHQVLTVSKKTANKLHACRTQQ